MEKIEQIRKTSIWIFVLPIIVLNLCLFISINYHLFENSFFEVSQTGRTSFTIPYIDGQVSISRVARTFPAYLIFKPGMIITAIFLIRYWILNNEVIKKIKNETEKNNSFLFFGVVSAIFLIAHSIFLGIHFDYMLYKFFRRFVLLGFVIFEIIAQALLIINIFKIKDKVANFINQKILILKAVLVTILITTALASLPILSGPGYTRFKHALEWDYFAGVILFYFLTFLFWKNKKNQVHTPEGA